MLDLNGRRRGGQDSEHGHRRVPQRHQRDGGNERQEYKADHAHDGFDLGAQDLSGGDPKALAQALRGLTVAANQDPQLTRVFSTFSATNPSIYLDIDRNKVQILGVQLNDVFQALQASLGGFYVNDLNLFGRRWQVNIQAEGVDRGKIDDIYRINVRNAEGKMIPLRSLLEARVVVGPPALIRYNNLRAVTVQGSPAPGISSGQALKAMEEVAARTLARALPVSGPTPPSRKSAPRARPP